MIMVLLLQDMFTYLMFSLIATTVILLLSGWVVYTVKTTRSLHKPYNTFITNLLVSDMIIAVLIFIFQCSMVIRYQFGVKLLVGYYMHTSLLCFSLLLVTISQYS